MAEWDRLTSMHVNADGVVTFPEVDEWAVDGWVRSQASYRIAGDRQVATWFWLATKETTNKPQLVITYR